jgi:hypothetical protein
MNKKIAIYNSLPCHYEMFGYIIFYCFLKKYTIHVFTETLFDMGWFTFYEKIFKNYNICFRNYREFNSTNVREEFDLIFLTTDDDDGFKYEWMTQKVVCINHYYICRRIDYFHCIAVRPFNKNAIKWGLPSFPIFDRSNKFFDSNNINICIVGGGNLDTNLYNTNIINRLKLNNENREKKIIVHVITRFATQKMIDNFQNKITNLNVLVKLYEHLNTENMLGVLMSSSYMLTDVTLNTDHFTGYSMSGSIPLAFSSLTRLILSKKNNKLYKFSSALEFTPNSNNDIILDSINDDIMDQIIYERSELIKMFHDNVDKIINQNGMA